MAMLTNPYETQVVQSLGVRIGPALSAVGGSDIGGGASTGTTSVAERGKCPFAAMVPTVEDAIHGGDARSASAGAERGEGVPASDGAGGSGGAKPPGLNWTAAAEARLANIPAFVRPMARTGIERFASERGALEVDEKILDAARDFFGM
jgi:hypothetical protein